MHPVFADLLSGFQRAATVHARLARVPDPEPEDFEPQDGPDYDDPDDLRCERWEEEGRALKGDQITEENRP